MKAAGPPASASAPCAAAGAARDASWPVALLGVPFEDIALPAAMERIGRMAESRSHHLVVVANAPRLLRAQRHPDLLRSLAEADLVLCDSRALRWASRLLGSPLQHRIRSAELGSAVLAFAAVRRLRVFLLHCGPNPVSVTRLKRRHPELVLAGSHCACRFDPERAAASIRQARPDVVLAWSGCAEADAWLGERFTSFTAPLCIHFPLPDTPNAGEPRASPSRWQQRVRACLRIGAQVWRLRRTLSSLAGAGALRSARRVRNWVDVDAGESLTRAALEREPSLWQTAGNADAHCAFDLSHVKHIDATGIAMLARQRAACRRQGLHLVLVAPSAVVHRALSESRLLSLFEIASSVAEARSAVPQPPGTPLPGVTRSLAWCGEIIAANAEDVWQMTSDYVRAFTAAGATLVVIDLARLRYIDSAGAALMIRVKQSGRAFQSGILFAHAQPAVVTALRLAQSDAFLLHGSQ